LVVLVQMQRFHGNLLKNRVGTSTDARGKSMIVALSGGVDSAVSAWLLQQAGYRVKGVFMRSWGTGDDAEDCTYRDDRLAARRVADFLRLDEFQEIDLRAEYWHSVFVPHLLEAYRRGLTPNPDLACNRYIKFGALLDVVAKRADILATGHYARCTGGQLYRALDRAKDQTYFLASIDPSALRKLHFPLGDWQKHEVRALARHLRLPNATRASSRGICFIGRHKSIASILDEFAPPGDFWPAVDIDTGRTLGRVSSYRTIGQRAGIGGLPQAFYVCDKDPARGIISVCAGRSHPALSCWGYEVEAFDLWNAWMEHQHLKESAGWLHRSFSFQAWYRQTPLSCLIRRLEADPLATSNDRAQPRVRVAAMPPQRLLVLVPGRSASAPVTAPGQAVVIYDEDQCVGGGFVRRLIRNAAEIPHWTVAKEFFSTVPACKFSANTDARSWASSER